MHLSGSSFRLSLEHARTVGRWGTLASFAGGADLPRERQPVWKDDAGDSDSLMSVGSGPIAGASKGPSTRGESGLARTPRQRLECGGCEPQQLWDWATASQLRLR